ncbi:chloramphenicol phosphotransferase, partial [Pseudomonas sp. BGM005]|nr:chloramphenicol phosphotransferase [Pseudomonas sp. BG5]
MQGDCGHCDLRDIPYSAHLSAENWKADTVMSVFVLLMGFPGVG